MSTVGVVGDLSGQAMICIGAILVVCCLGWLVLRNKN